MTPSRSWIALALAGMSLAACSKTADPPSKGSSAAADTAPLRITQFYATAPKVAKGEQELICYGVEGASKVTLEPPPQELSAALARCVEVSPKETTKYTLTATGKDGKTVTQELTVALGVARVRVKIVEVKVSALEIQRGTPVSLCYIVENARSVEIEPARYRGGPNPRGCTAVQPDKTTTYIVTATGADGDRDQEKVTVRVK